MAFSFNGFGGGSDYRPPSSITNNMGSWGAPLNYTSPFQSTDPNGTNYTTAANATRMNSMMGQQQPQGLGSVAPGQPQPGGPQLFDAMTNIGQPQQPQSSAYSGGGRFFNGQQIGGGQQITRNGQNYLTPGAMGGGMGGGLSGLGQGGFSGLQGGNRFFNGTQIGGMRNIGGQMMRTPGAMGGGLGGMRGGTAGQASPFGGSAAPAQRAYVPYNGGPSPSSSIFGNTNQSYNQPQTDNSPVNQSFLDSYKPGGAMFNQYMSNPSVMAESNPQAAYQATGNSYWLGPQGAAAQLYNLGNTGLTGNPAQLGFSPGVGAAYGLQNNAQYNPAMSGQYGSR